MSHGEADLTKIVDYMKAHWPSRVKEEWQVGLEEYALIAKKVLADFCVGKSQGRRLVRIAGISGSGKTTQLLPAAEAYFEANNAEPILVAARRFVKYHPHYAEILDFYGEENLRKMTDEFATIMMFLVLGELIKNSFDIILDVTLLDPKMEQILIGMMQKNQYTGMILMITVAPEVTERFLGERSWRHTKETEQEFVRVTELAMEYYSEKCPEMRCVMWNVFEKEPVFDGEIKDALASFKKYTKIIDIPEYNKDELRFEKIKYLVK